MFTLVELQHGLHRLHERARDAGLDPAENADAFQAELDEADVMAGPATRSPIEQTPKGQ